MSIKRFALWTAFWLPLSFAAWYFSSILFTAPLAGIADWLSTALLPQLVSAVETEGNKLLVVLALEARGPGGEVLPGGELLFEINPLIYGYSIPPSPT